MAVGQELVVHPFSPVVDGHSRVLILGSLPSVKSRAVSYTHLRAHETDSYLVCRLLLEKKNISEHTRLGMISYAVYCLKKKNKTT